MNLRFEFRVMTEGGECVVSDWTTFDPTFVDENGACETVDMHTGAAMRFVRRSHVAGKLEPEAA